jgi:hypothetical protein
MSRKEYIIAFVNKWGDHAQTLCISTAGKLKGLTPCVVRRGYRHHLMQRVSWAQSLYEVASLLTSAITHLSTIVTTHPQGCINARQIPSAGRKGSSKKTTITSCISIRKSLAFTKDYSAMN